MPYVCGHAVQVPCLKEIMIMRMGHGVGNHSLFKDFVHWLMLQIIRKGRLPSGMSLGARVWPDR